MPDNAVAVGVVRVAELRRSASGRALVAAMRSAGGERWEQTLGVSLDSDVTSVLLVGRELREPAQSPVSAPRSFARRSGALFVVELSDEAAPAAGCHASDWRRAQPERLATPLGEMALARCGPFVAMACSGCPGVGDAPSSGEGSAGARAVSAAGPAQLVAALSSEVADRAPCEGGRIALSGWLRLGVVVEDGARATARVSAVDPSRRAQLLRCVQDGVAELADELGNNPIAARLGLSAILARVRVEEEPREQKEVVARLDLTEAEVAIVADALALLAGSALP